MKARPPGTELPLLLLTQLALLCVAGFYYGPRAWILGGISAFTCFALNYICITLRRIPFRAAHLDALSTGLTLVLLMPASVPYDILIISCFAAIIIGKQLFGGRQNLLFPPAAVGYLFAVMSWRQEILQFPAPFTRLPLLPTVQPMLSDSASAVFLKSGMVASAPAEKLWLGLVPGPMGTTAAVLLLVCCIILLLRRCISAPACLGAVCTVCATLTLAGLRLGDTAFLQSTLLQHMTLFSVIYLIGDRRLAPKGSAGLLYGILAGGMGLYFTLSFHVEYGFVIAAVVFSPLSIFLRAKEICPQETHSTQPTTE